MRRYYVQGGQILAGPFDVSPPSQAPFYTNPTALKLYEKTPEKLLALGWLPEEVVGYEPFNQKTQIRTGPTRTILADRVVSTYTITNKTVRQMAAEKQSAAEDRISDPAIQAVLETFAELALQDETKVKTMAIQKLRAKL